jgi:exodeoxyribonuclease V gamma subunit
LPDLPARFSVFGLSTLPPYYLQVFDRLAEHLDLHFFFLNPCREYWGDIVPGKTIDKISRKDRGLDDLHLSQGNPLLASTGQQGREMLNMLTECRIGGEHELFSPSEKENDRILKLAAVQDDILDLRDGLPWSGEIYEDEDRSIQIHSCHSPMREVEVLHDQLLAMFEEDPDLEPRDIMVMTPDIELYSPLIDAVFSSRQVGSGQRLPFSITDRKVRKEGELVGSFLSIIELAGRRLEIGEVLAVLEKEPVRRRFGISPDDLELVAKWLAGVNVCWGVDGDDRQQMGLPAVEENTWRSGLDRLLLGYAAVGDGHHDFAGILPFDDIEGGEVEVLGRFLDFTGELFRYVRLLAGSNTLGEWFGILRDLFNDLLAVDDGEETELKFVVAIINNLRLEMEESGYTDKVDFEAIKAELTDACEDGSLTTGFMVGGITFCEMLPMRAVPFKAVCLLGMNDGAFPRTTSIPSFDLIGVEPRPGDRSRRKDDRYLFLEAIISAREYLYICYVGQSVRDGSKLLPSVLVSELIEYLGRRFPSDRDCIVTTHPLQPFSPGYFLAGSELFSYSASNFMAARALTGSKTSRIFISDKFSAPPEELKEVSLDELVFFFSNTSRFFCQRRMGIFLGGDTEEFSGSESFDLDPLTRFNLGGILLKKILAGEQVDEVFHNAKRQGIMPHGSIGPAVYNELLGDVEAVADKLAKRGADVTMSPLVASVEIGDFTVSGRIDSSPDNGQYLWRYSQLKSSDLVRAWLYHLFLDSVAPAEWSRVTHVGGRDKNVSFTALENGDDLFADVLDLYWQGMEAPLPFFPAASQTFYESEDRELGNEHAMLKARQKWLGSDYSRGEADDPYHQLCYSGREPLTDDFSRFAKSFFKPLSEWCR